MRILDDAFLDRLAAEAAASPRRRKNFNLHASPNYPCQRFFNALCADTYVQPHRHMDPSKDESLVLLRGKLGAVIFDDAGQVLSASILHPGQVADVPYNTFHTWIALEDGTLFFEAKAGPYVPLVPAEKAAFAPPEGDPKAPAYLAWLKSLCSATGSLQPPPPPSLCINKIPPPRPIGPRTPSGTKYSPSASATARRNPTRAPRISAASASPAGASPPGAWSGTAVTNGNAPSSTTSGAPSSTAVSAATSSACANSSRTCSSSASTRST
ncbi:MAG: cupin fold metalloprotein, WbuC family [Opitutae bacterium]|nr:cupin fold metalloprotein, WbuC family [Opitutae bacterium]